MPILLIGLFLAPLLVGWLLHSATAAATAAIVEASGVEPSHAALVVAEAAEACSLVIDSNKRTSVSGSSRDVDDVALADVDTDEEEHFSAYSVSLSFMHSLS